MHDEILARPGDFCGALAEGRTPDVVADGAPEEIKGELVTRLSAMCQDHAARLFFGILEDTLEEDPEVFCQTVDAAESPDALASAIFTDAQVQGFRTMLTAEEKGQFVVELRSFCGRGTR